MIYENICAVCGDRFITHTKTAKYCSEKCREIGKKRYADEHREMVRKERDACIQARREKEKRMMNSEFTMERYFEDAKITFGIYGDNLTKFNLDLIYLFDKLCGSHSPYIVTNRIFSPFSTDSEAFAISLVILEEQWNKEFEPVDDFEKNVENFIFHSFGVKKFCSIEFDDSNKNVFLESDCVSFGGITTINGHKWTIIYSYPSKMISNIPKYLDKCGYWTKFNNLFNFYDLYHK